MATYYIDSNLGKPTNDGLSETSPLNTHSNIKLNPGDIVLFKCGTVYREGIVNTLDGEKCITYGTYGEGEPPVFYGSENFSKPDYWIKTEDENIWMLNYPLSDEPCNIIFNYGKDYGKLAWSYKELNKQGKFWSDVFGYKVSKTPFDKANLYLYSEENPGKYYKDIEIAFFEPKSILNAKTNTCFDGLHILNAGVHGYGISKPKNITIKNCIFENIGGCVWDLKQKIRYGNGVECWDGGENVSVTNCTFLNIFDSCFTTQGSSNMSLHENIVCANCLMDKFGMAAFELRDKMGISVKFENNKCYSAGSGFALNDEPIPRYSEIYPEPMGHFIFVWRGIKTEKGCVEIKNNKFYGSPTGEVIYIRKDSEEAKDNIIFENNEILDS